jgi:hypothetical protein
MKEIKVKSLQIKNNKIKRSHMKCIILGFESTVQG